MFAHKNIRRAEISLISDWCNDHVNTVFTQSV